jgi:hypothetical protein
MSYNTEKLGPAKSPRKNVRLLTYPLSGVSFPRWAIPHSLIDDAAGALFGRVVNAA